MPGGGVEGGGRRLVGSEKVSAKSIHDKKPCDRRLETVPGCCPSHWEAIVKQLSDWAPTPRALHSAWPLCPPPLEPLAPCCPPL